MEVFKIPNTKFKILVQTNDSTNNIIIGVQSLDHKIICDIAQKIKTLINAIDIDINKVKNLYIITAYFDIPIKFTKISSLPLNIMSIEIIIENSKSIIPKILTYLKPDSTTIIPVNNFKDEITIEIIKLSNGLTQITLILNFYSPYWIIAINELSISIVLAIRHVIRKKIGLTYDSFSDVKNLNLIFTIYAYARNEDIIKIGKSIIDILKNFKFTPELNEFYINNIIIFYFHFTQQIITKDEYINLLQKNVNNITADIRKCTPTIICSYSNFIYSILNKYINMMK
jgi:hypothetical protein